VHEFTAHDKQQRLEFAARAKHEKVRMHNIWFTFSLGWHSEQAKCAILGFRNPRMSIGKMHHAPKLTVWVAISSHGDGFPLGKIGI
jgi:hypothetical protein